MSSAPSDYEAYRGSNSMEKSPVTWLTILEFLKEKSDVSAHLESMLPKGKVATEVVEEAKERQKESRRRRLTAVRTQSLSSKPSEQKKRTPDDSAFFQELAEQLVDVGVRHGYVDLLMLLFDAKLWFPSHSLLDLRRAEEAGSLAKLLVYFDMPIECFPDFAQDHVEEALQQVDRLDEKPLEEHRGPGPKKASGQAMLLANFLLVPSSAADNFMNGMSQQMVVFNTKKVRNPSDRVDDLQDHLARGHHPRVAAESDIRPQTPRDHDARHPHVVQYCLSAADLQQDKICKESGMDYPTRLGYVWLQEGKNHGLEKYRQSDDAMKSCGTSTKHYINALTPESREALLVPGRAVSHIFVDATQDRRAGFLYLDDHDSFVGFFELHFKQPKGDKIVRLFLTDGAAIPTRCLEESDPKWETRKANDIPEEAKRLDDAGVRRFMWLMPNDPVAQHMVVGPLGALVCLEDGNNTKFHYFSPRMAAKPEEDSPMPLKCGRKPLSSTAHTDNFPLSIGPIFVVRKKAFHIDHYDGKANILEIHVGDGSKEKIRLKTSEAAKVTLEGSHRASALIPASAEKFTYVEYDDKHLEVGGFLYLGGDDEPLQLNVLSFDRRRRHCLSFGPFVYLPPGTGKKLKERAQAVSVQRLKDAGATHYLWIAPGEELSGGFKAQAGGFAYLFEDPDDDRFFPLMGAGEVLQSGPLSGEGERRCSMLPRDADGKCIDKDMFWPAFHGCKIPQCLRMFVRARATPDSSAGSVPVTFSRFKLPDPTHPVVLRALKLTPRRQVLRTLGAQAITQFAFEQGAWSGAVLDLIFELFGLVCVSVCAGAVRSGELASGAADLHWITIICFFYFVFDCLRDSTAEFFGLIGYVRRGWLRDYFTKDRALFWAYLLIEMSLISLAIACVVSGWQDLLRTLKPLIAFVGCTKWLRSLYLCRGFEWFHLGSRILPIFSALREAGDFVVIFLFFVCAGAHAYYALSPGSVDYKYILFAVYRLGFLGDFEVHSDVLFLENDDDEPTDMALVQYCVFIVISASLTIAMMNIFIGVMSNSFDFYQDRTSELFTRARAAMALEQALFDEGKAYAFGAFPRFPPCPRKAPKLHHGRGDRLWVCCQAVLDDDDNEAQNTTIRSAIFSQSQHLLKKIDELQKLIDSGGKGRGRLSRVATNDDHSEASKGDACAEQNQVASEKAASPAPVVAGEKAIDSVAVPKPACDVVGTIDSAPRTQRHTKVSNRASTCRAGSAELCGQQATGRSDNHTGAGEADTARDLTAASAELFGVPAEVVASASLNAKAGLCENADTADCGQTPRRRTHVVTPASTASTAPGPPADAKKLVTITGEGAQTGVVAHNSLVALPHAGGSPGEGTLHAAAVYNAASAGGVNAATTAAADIVADLERRASAGQHADADDRGAAPRRRTRAGCAVPAPAEVPQLGTIAGVDAHEGRDGGGGAHMHLAALPPGVAPPSVWKGQVAPEHDAADHHGGATSPGHDHAAGHVVGFDGADHDVSGGRGGDGSVASGRGGSVSTANTSTRPRWRSRFGDAAVVTPPQQPFLGHGPENPQWYWSAPTLK